MLTRVRQQATGRQKRWAPALGLALALGLPALAQTPLNLHRPSPDWRDQVLYFVVTDRFDDGDPANNDQGAGEFDPRSNAHYNGGDFKGLQRRIDYIRGLGATGLWITPPVANQWWDAKARYSGYHGYWAENFMQVDKHLGTLDNYKALSHALHERGMVLVQDIVLNHTGNFFGYPGAWSARNPAIGWTANTGSQPLAAPSQPPFDQNDARKPAHRTAGIYHWTPDVRDFTKPRQVLNWQMSGLDDLNTENPAVRRALRQSYGHWVREVGVDGFRLDTAFYVPPALMHDFLRSPDPAAPGIERVARATGRDAFYTFGEGFAIDKPYATRQARRIERYVRSQGARAGRPLMPGMLHFTLYGSLGDVLARGAPTAVLGHRITQSQRVHSDPHRMATFVDNHDVDRYLAGGTEAGLRQALLALMTLPGVPVIYYGTEQGFTEQRGAMFAGGFGSGGRDRFDVDHALYRSIVRLTALRREHRVFSRGVPTVLQASATGPGVLAWRMQYGGDAALVVLNTADAPTLMTGLPTGLPPGTALPGLLALDGEPATLRAGAGGRLNAVLPARSGQVWRLSAADGPRATDAPADTTPALRLMQAKVAANGDQLLAAGQAPAGTSLQLVVDGEVGRAVTTQADPQGRWQATLPIDHLPDGPLPHRLVAWRPAQPDAAPAQTTFTVQRPWVLVADQRDAAGDDHGLTGRYTYPTDASWGHHRQMDLRHARVWRAGQALKIELTMAGITQTWGPPNGFDHVNLTLFFSQPGRADGLAEMPLQQASLPEGWRWQYRLRVGGWSNALYTAAGASATAEGTPVTPGAQLAVDAARRRIILTLPAGALGTDLSGLRIHVTTWDYDGGYRALAPQAGGHTLGGGPADGPKVMDAMTLVLP